MADNNTFKGIGIVAILSLFAIRTCKSCDDMVRVGGKQVDNFSCNPPRKINTDPVNPPHLIEPLPPFKPEIEPGVADAPPPAPIVKKTMTVNVLLASNVFEDLSNVQNTSNLSKELESKIFSVYFELKQKAPPRQSGMVGGGTRDKDFYDKLYSDYESIKTRLNEVFTEDDYIYLNFLKESYKTFDGYRNSPSYSRGGTFKVQLIPDYLIEPSNKINLNSYFLYTGFNISPAQQKVITNINSFGFTNVKRDLDNCIVIENQGDKYVFRTLQKVHSVTDITSSLKEVDKLSSKQILVKGAVSQELVEFLRDNKVRIVANAMKYFDIINLQKQKIKYYVIIPEKDDDLVKMYGIQQAQIKDIRILLNEFAALPNTRTLKTIDDLENQFSDALANSESSILIFNNTNGMLFDKPIEYHRQLKNVITCNSLSLESANLTFNSTDYLYIKQTFNALRKTNINREMRLDEFYFSFAQNYNLEIAKSNRNMVFNLVLLGVGGAGIFTGAIYLGNQKK